MRFLAAALSVGIGWASAATAPPPVRGDILYTEAPHFEPAAARTGGERFPSGARLMIWSRGAVRPLVPAFAASADPALSFDGARVLFSGRKRPGDPWRIWELSLAAGQPRQVTAGAGDCLRPLYLPLQKLAYGRRTPAGTQIELAPVAGGAPAQITFSSVPALPAALLRDGRILFEAGDLFAVHSDGSGVESYRCDHGPARVAAAQLSSGDVVFQIPGGLARFSSPRAVQLDVPLPPGEYSGPVAELNGRWLAACRAGICSIAPGSSEPPAIVVSGSAWQPVPIERRPVPPYHPSSLGEAEGSRLLCLNAYASRSGPLPPGSIASVRLWSREGPLGQAAVDPDGSFFVQVPADRPLRFELLDREGRTLRAQKDFFWARNGEQRVCVGCHTGPERAPDNLAPRVLQRTQVPVPIAAAGGR
jgi:hypothetical protein